MSCCGDLFEDEVLLSDEEVERDAIARGVRPQIGRAHV